MPIKHAALHTLCKPWGRSDLSPWGKASGRKLIGEIWFESVDAPQQVDPKLLLKVLFTNETLSIQVHPDDDFARLIGLNGGKTEAWYILSAEPGAQVALGLKEKLTRKELRQACLDGSIRDIVQWRSVVAGDFIFVPAGTIHAIGAGLVVAEVQQRSDTTFRLFDFGRGREIHVDQAVAVADLGPAKMQESSVNLTDMRTQLISCPFFTLELVTIPAGTHWELKVDCECWVMVIAGGASFGATHASVGEVLVSQACRSRIDVDSSGLKALVAYVDAQPNRDLFAELGSDAAMRPSLGLDEAIAKKSVDGSILTREMIQ